MLSVIFKFLPVNEVERAVGALQADDGVPLGDETDGAMLIATGARSFLVRAGLRLLLCVVDLPEHPFDVATAAVGLRATVIRVPVCNWNDSLTPWPAAGLRPDAPAFGGHAAETFAELTGVVIPEVEAACGLVPERRAICGYSLGGLFSLYAFAHEGSPFAACACLSGSVWYEGWVDYLRRTCPDSAGRYAYFSIGKKERRAGAPIMRTVQEDLETCAAVLRERGCAVDLVVGPGNHMQHHTELLAAGLKSLDAYLAV